MKNPVMNKKTDQKITFHHLNGCKKGEKNTYKRFRASIIENEYSIPFVGFN